jgi:hypothetical protein
MLVAISLLVATFQVAHLSTATGLDPPRKTGRVELFCLFNGSVDGRYLCEIKPP